MNECVREFNEKALMFVVKLTIIRLYRVDID